MVDLGITNAALAKEIGIDVRSVEKLRRNSGWRLTKRAFDDLMLWAFEHGYPEGLFLIRQHPIWSGFQNAPIKVFRSTPFWDAKLEGVLTSFFHKLGGKWTTEIDCDNAGSIQKAMSTCNCVFIGSPKSNVATEVALSLFWNARPFDADERNRRQLPLQFLGMKPRKGTSSAFLAGGTRHGFLLRLPDQPEPSFLRVDWRTPQRYRAYSGDGTDAAVLVACRKPLAAKKQVSSVVVAGYTGRATYLAGKGATTKEIPIREEDLANSATPQIAAFKYDYKKLKDRGKKSLTNQRKPDLDSFQWGPPWEGFVQ